MVCIEYLDIQQNSIERIFRQDAAREKRNVKEEKQNRAASVKNALLRRKHPAKLNTYFTRDKRQDIAR